MAGKANDPLIDDLKRWGMAHANRYAFSRSDLTRHHMLDKARDMAPGANAMRELVKRDGGERRAFMAARSGNVGMKMTPTWAVDPIRATNNADKPHDNPEIAVDMGIPDDLLWIDRALSSMSRQYLLRSIVLRVHYTTSTSHAIKVRVVCQEFEDELGKRLGIKPQPKEDGAKPAITVRQYWDELAKAVDILRLMGPAC